MQLKGKPFYFLIFLICFVFSLNLNANPQQEENKKTKPEKELTVSQKINNAFVPVVEKMKGILFFDPFSVSGIYDPKVYDENGEIVKENGKDKKVNIPFIVMWMAIGALFFTIGTRFWIFKKFKHAIDVVRGKYDKKDEVGEVSRFQALSTALSGTVGLGNIAGVAIAVEVGGAGATLWMIIAAFFGMATKFMEGTLGVKYRIMENGKASGGAMYYIKQGLANRKLPKIGLILAGLYAFLMVGSSLGGGCMFQANQTAEQIAQYFPAFQNNGIYVGIILLVLVGAVIIGGIKSIAKTTEMIVPAMAVLYIGMALLVIFMNIENLGTAINEIVIGAFDADAMKGGIIGAIVVGVQRAVFSNGAGMGDCAIAHAAAKVEEPVSEGFVASIEPFIDTVIICSMTAFVIVFTGYNNPEIANGVRGAALTTKAFESVFSWSHYVLLIAVFLFAISTIITWSYYGLKAFDFLFGKLSMRFFGTKKVSTILFQALYLICILIGASASLGVVLDFTDMMVLCMTFPNILAMMIIFPEVWTDLKNYIGKLKTGEIKKYR